MQRLSSPFSPQRFPRKSRQDKAGLVNVLVVVSTQLFLLLGIPAPHRRRDVSVLVFAADHEAYLARRVGGDGGVGVFDHGEDFPAGLFEVGDEGEVEPLVFRCGVGQPYISRGKREREREEERVNQNNRIRTRTDNLES